MDCVRMQRFLEQQSGLISRRQVLSLGGDDALIAKRIRRREWVRVHNGVFITHTGSLTWLQRAWAGLLFCSPAALSHQSALRAYGVRTTQVDRSSTINVDGSATIDWPSDASVRIHVAVAASRRVVEPPGIRLHRVSDFGTAVRANPTPPRLNLEHSLLDVAASAHRETDAVALLADACQGRRTTPERLLQTLRARSRLARRKYLLAVLADVSTGAYSALEHRYLTRVERPHGLPTGQRQRRIRSGRTVAYRDVEYLGLATVIELDGNLGHVHMTDRWDDMTRDIASALSGDTTLRLGWRHVEDSCRTAVAVASLLTAKGWTGEPRPCSAGCLVERRWRISFTY
jgi:hypothetical protein